MSLDLSPNRLVSCKDRCLTLAHIITQARSPQGLIYNWQSKDHRLFRVCKSLVRHDIFSKTTPEPGVTIFHMTEIAKRLFQFDKEPHGA